MATLGGLLGLAVAAILFISGVSKLRALSRFETALVGTYGVPANVARLVRVLVPVSELGVAFLLLLPGSRPAGAALAVPLLAAITLAAFVAWSLGRHGDCGCWGGLHAEELGPLTILRGGLLTGTAAVAWLAQAIST